MNPMRTIRIEKVTLNIGAGKEQKDVDKALKLIKHITGIDPVKTVATKRIPGWGVRPGLPIGCKLTLRKENAKKLLKRLLEAKDNTLSDKQIDNQGNIAFGIPEYINIPDVKYDPEIGVIGLQACVTLERPGFRIKKRRMRSRKIGRKHSITKDEAIEYMKKEFGVAVGG